MSASVQLENDEMFRITSRLKFIKTIHLCNNKIKYTSSYLSELNCALEKINTLEMFCILDNAMSAEETISFALICADNCSSIRCIQIPCVKIDELTQIKHTIEDIKVKRSQKGNYNGLYAVCMKEGCVH